MGHGSMGGQTLGQTPGVDLAPHFPGSLMHRVRDRSQYPHARTRCAAVWDLLLPRHPPGHRAGGGPVRRHRHGRHPGLQLAHSSGLRGARHPTGRSTPPCHRHVQCLIFQCCSGSRGRHVPDLDDLGATCTASAGSHAVGLAAIHRAGCGNGARRRRSDQIAAYSASSYPVDGP